MTINIFKKVIFCSLIFFQLSCKKFLSEKSDQKLAVPNSLEHYLALLDTYSLYNFANSGEISSDDFTISDADYNKIGFESDKRLYTWQPDNVANTGNYGNDWMSCYQAIYTSNVVLKELEDNRYEGAENVKGMALFYRGARYLDAAQIWAPVYNKQTAAKEMGLPIRLDPDMNIPSKRSNLEQTYEQIIKDLNEATKLLNEKQISVQRPAKWAAYGLLARTYLWMGDYSKALENVEKCLMLYDLLMNYNTLNPNDAYPIKRVNVETGLLSIMAINSGIMYSDIPDISKELYNLYAENDLRKSIFFKSNAYGKIMFRGNYYDQRGVFVTGPATDEMYLIAAECHARLGNVNQSMDVLNKLLVNRWKTGSFIKLIADNKEHALEIILKERRKELLFRGLRWPDLKRFNRDGANNTLSRTVAGNVYSLPPNDPRYAIAIPEDIIQLTGMPQNKR